MPPLTAAAKLRPSFSGTWRLLGEAAGLVVDLPDEVVEELQVPGCLLADGGEGVVQVGVMWTGYPHNLKARGEWVGLRNLTWLLNQIDSLQCWSTLNVKWVDKS